MLISTLASIQAGNNQDIIANSVAYLNKKANTITIRQNYDSVTYVVSASQDKLIQRAVIMAPFTIIVIGIVVWRIRKRRK